MDELSKIEAWIETLNFGEWSDDEDEQLKWLAARDSPQFDSQWMRIFDLVKVQEEDFPLSESERQKITDIRRVGYFTTMKWAVENEVPAYASDDFELLARAARVGLTDFWLDKLRAKYQRGEFPHGVL